MVPRRSLVYRRVERDRRVHIDFDRAGYRIGYGAGYYDMTLAALRAKKKIVAIGLGFASQEVEKVPVEAHDQRLDFIITEAGLVFAAGRA